MSFLINSFKFGAPWTPTQVTPMAWFDASDATTITESGGAVSEWRDKSGNTRHIAQATGTQQPTYSNSTVVFDGVDDLLKRSTAFMYANGSVDVYFVAAIDVTAFDRRLFVESNSSDNDTFYSIFESGRSPDGSRTGAFIRDNGGTIRFNNNISASGALDLSTRKFYQARDTGSAIAHRVSGGTLASVSYTRGTTTVNRFGLGAFPQRPNVPDGGSFLRCDLNEVIVVPSLLADADRQKMEGYLAWKWGLQGSLTSGHPYEAGAPMI